MLIYFHHKKKIRRKNHDLFLLFLSLFYFLPRNLWIGKWRNMKEISCLFCKLLCSIKAFLFLSNFCYRIEKIYSYKTHNLLQNCKFIMRIIQILFFGWIIVDVILNSKTFLKAFYLLKVLNWNFLLSRSLLNLVQIDFNIITLSAVKFESFFFAFPWKKGRM